MLISRDMISCVDHGVYDIAADDIPCCPVCDQPMQKGERITLQTCDAGPGHPDLLRLVHSECVENDDED
mgnify:CR=1 FL=1